MTAHHIAILIDRTAKAATSGELSLETCSDINRGLWNLAREKGISKEVDGYLQEWSIKEIEAAIALSEGRQAHSGPF